MTNQPNIFNYATSELTQDAFITWLLHWANPIYKDENELLYNLGTSFLKSLLACQNVVFNGEISDLKIKQQFHKIDIFVSFKMNECSYGIIIEDKVHSIDHGNQLERYINKITALQACHVLIPIYFKTGYQVNFESIEKSGYHHYSIKDFLKQFSKESITEINNDVLSQYYTYLLKKVVEYDYADNQANNYLTKPLKEWTRWTCVRFFHEYKGHFKAGWGEVPNNRERLVAFWFGGRDFASNDIHNKQVVLHLYMDIVFKKNKIVVSYRIGLKKKEQIDLAIRNNIFNGLVPFLEKHRIITRKATYKKAKETMLLCEITNLDMEMNYEAFVRQIEVYQEALNEYVNNKKICQ